LLIAGPMGSGKTTAVQSLSEIPVVSTEAHNNDRAQADKLTTTVALDYGEITLSPEHKLRMYGVPGQRRFSFMWKILQERAEGLLLLVHNDAPDPVPTVLEYLEDFQDLIQRGAVAIGVTRMELLPRPTIPMYVEALRAAYPNITIPVFSVDAREAGQLQKVLVALVAAVEATAMVGAANEGARR